MQIIALSLSRNKVWFTNSISEMKWTKIGQKNSLTFVVENSRKGLLSVKLHFSHELLILLLIQIANDRDRVVLVL